MKRLFDFVVAAMLLLVLSPILVLIGIVTRTTMGAPVLFRQKRPGLGGKPFTLMKFRTMTAARSAGLSDERRLTSIGSLLRRWSLDELPELWNVLRGDMSLVGPRPLLMEYLGRYNAHQARRHAVKPGITGWAQVNGRNSLTWEEKFDLDVWYVDHQSFWLDLRILALTARQVLSRRGISHPGSVTMPEFQGAVSHERGSGTNA